MDRLNEKLMTLERKINNPPTAVLANKSISSNMMTDGLNSINFEGNNLVIKNINDPTPLTINISLHSMSNIKNIEFKDNSSITGISTEPTTDPTKALAATVLIDIDSKIGGITEDVTNITDRITGIDHIGGMTVIHNELFSPTTEHLKQRADVTDQQIGSLTQGTNNRFDEIDTSISDMNNDITDLQILPAKLTNIESNITDLDDRVTTNTTNIDKINNLSDWLFKSKLTDLFYPVGSIYQSINTTSPESLFGGFWDRIPDNRILMNAGSTVGLNNTAGSATVKLTVNNLPSHRHQWDQNTKLQSGNTTHCHSSVPVGDGYVTVFSGYTGGDQPFSIIPPVFGVYTWVRVG